MREWDPGEEPGEPVTVRWARLAARRWAVGAAVFLVVIGAVATVLLVSRPIWRGEARLRLTEPPPSPSISPTGGLFSLLRPGGDPFANDMELLGSRTVAEDVTEALALDTRLEAPRGWYRDSLFVSLTSTGDTDEAVFEVTWAGGGQVTVERVEPPPRAPAARGPIGTRLHFGGVVVVPGKPRPGAPTSVRLRTIAFGEAAERFRSALDFERSRRDAYVLDVSYDHADPGIAREAVETALRRFVALRGELFERESGTTADSLRLVVARTEAELARAESELEAIQRQSGLVAPDAQAEAFVERWVETEGELEAARAELALVEGALVRAGEAAAPGDAWTALVAQPRFLDNPTLGEMLVRLVELEEQRVVLATRRSPESREYTVLVDQIAFLDASLRALAQSHAASLRSAVAEMEERERRLSARLEGLPAAVLDVARRQRDVRVLTEVLVATEGRLRQEEVRRALTYANVQIVDPPALEFEPIWPRKGLGAAVGLVLAVGTGLLAMVVVDRADGRLRRAADLRTLGGVRVLAAPVAAAAVGGVSGAEVEAVRRAFAGGTVDGVAVCGLDDSEHARALAAALREVSGPVDVWSVGPVATPDEVATALRGSGPGVVLVVRRGRTHGRTVARAVKLFRDAGAPVLGAVLVCRSRREAEAAWS